MDMILFFSTCKLVFAQCDFRCACRKPADARLTREWSHYFMFLRVENIIEKSIIIISILTSIRIISVIYFRDNNNIIML